MKLKTKIGSLSQAVGWLVKKDYKIAKASVISSIQERSKESSSRSDEIDLRREMRKRNGSLSSDSEDSLS